MMKPGGPYSDRAGLATGAGMALALALAGCTPLPPVPAGMGPSAPGTNVLNVADAAISGNDPQMALKVSQSVLTSDPKNLDALYHEGEAYYAMGRCEDSIAAYKVALTIEPGSSDAQTGIGRCLLKQNAASAELAFAAAVQDNASNAAALNDLGIARDLQGKYAAATQPYEQALLIDPGTEATEVNLGMSEALSGDSQDALQYLGPLATGEAATPKIRQDYAAALIAAGRDDEAQQVLNIDLAPDQVTAFMNDVSTVIAESRAAAAAAAAASAPAASPGGEPVSGTAAVTPVTAAPVLASPAAAAPAAPPAVTPAPMAPAAAISAPIMTPATPMTATAVPAPVTPMAPPTPTPTPPPAAAPPVSMAPVTNAAATAPIPPAAPPPLPTTSPAPASQGTAATDQVVR